MKCERCGFPLNDVSYRLDGKTICFACAEEAAERGEAPERVKK